MYDVFKAGAYLNDIPHNFSSNAYSPYAGIGGNTLIATFPLGALPSPQPPGNWSNFTLGYDRRDAGGYAEWQKNSPWYFRVDGNQVTFSGTKVGSGANGTSPGNGFVDLAIPDPVHDEQLGRRGRLPDEQGDLSRPLGLQQVRQRQPDAAVDESRSSAATSSTRPICRPTTRSTSSRCPATTATCRGVRSSPRATRGRRRRATSGSRQTALNTGAAYAPTLSDTGNFNGENINQSFALAWTANAAEERRHSRLLLLDEAREQLDGSYVRQRADAPARKRPRLR